MIAKGRDSRDMTDVRADYDMSRETRFNRRRTGLANLGGGPDYHYRIDSDYYRDIEKARDADRNDMIIGQTVTRAVNNIVQNGFVLDPTTGDKGLDDELFARWQDFSETCDIAGEASWNDFENQACRSMLVDGDCAVLGTDSGQFQFIEAHSIQTKGREDNTVLGVTRDDYGRRLKYWIMQEPTEAYKQGTKANAEPIETFDADGIRQIFHVYNSKRMLMTRGVTALAPIFVPSGMFDDINFAKLVQQQIVSCFAIFRKRNGAGGSGAPRKTQGYGAPSTEIGSTGTRYLEGIAPGMEIIGDDGEELQGFSPNVPGEGYFQQAKLLLQIIGVNLGLPLCLVLMDGSETNFSGWRGAVDEARKGFKSNQQNLIRRLHKPAYLFKLNQWMAEDPAIREVGSLSGISLTSHKWRAPRWQYIEPVADAQGASLRMTTGQAAPSDIAGEQGSDWMELSDRIVSDWGYAIRKAKREAMAINQEFDDDAPVHWRECLNIVLPQGIQMTMQDPNAQKQSAAPRQLSIAEALQKIYLSVGTVLTSEEARKIIEKEYGLKLPEDFDFKSAGQQ